MGELHHAGRRRQGGRRSAIDPELAENQLIFPNEETLSQAHIFRTLTGAEEQKYQAEFQSILLGAVSVSVREFAERGADLELVGIQKRFPGFTAIEDLDLTIPAGSFFALLGPSGCGKTTTLRLVAGLEEPTRGRILIGGKDVTDTKSHQRPVNTVFQSYALFPHMTVIENVAFGLKRRRIADPVGKAHEALRLVELDHLAQRQPAAALRRPAAARRAGARDREPTGAAAARRAARRARPEAPPADAARAQDASRRRSASPSCT